MAHRARDDLDDFLDTIDLTLSSPEPEPETEARAAARTKSTSTPKQSITSRPPKSSWPGWNSGAGPAQKLSSRHPSPIPVPAPTPSTQQQRAHHQPMHHSTTQRPSTSTQPPPRAAPQHSHQRPTTTTSHPPPPAAYQDGRTVDPHHLSRILETSDVRAIRHVLLTLCKKSPALAGAVARGMAPYSVFAQAVIKDAERRRGVQVGMGDGRGSSQRHPAHPHVKTDSYRVTPKREPPSRETGSEYAKRVRDRVAREMAAAVSSARAGSASSSVRIKSPARRLVVQPRVPGTYPSGSVEDEREGSPTDSDDSNHIVPIIGTQPREHRTPRQPSSSGQNHSSFSQRPTTPTPTTQRGVKATCVRCHEAFIKGLGEPDTCVYHPSTGLIKLDLDQTVFACCHKPAWAPGCIRGHHISREPAAEARSPQTPPQVRAAARRSYDRTNKRRRL